MRLFKYRKLVKLGKATYKDLCDADEKFTLLQSQGSDAEADRYYHYTIRLANEIYALVSVAWLVFGVDTTKFTLKIGMGGE